MVGRKKGFTPTENQRKAGQTNLQKWKSEHPGDQNRKHNLYIDINGLDGRTQTAKSVKVIKKLLREYVKISNPIAEALIGRITFKLIRLSLCEKALLENPGMKIPAHYIPMSNSLRLDCVALQGFVGAEKGPDLMEYLRENYNG